MTHDPEAAWPLTQTETGYIPSATPAPPLPQSNLIPIGKNSALFMPSGAHGPSWGQRIAILAIVLGISIPLTAIAGGMLGLIGVGVAWAGIVLVTAIIMGIGIRRN
ncbi:MAG: hypothetical protein LBE83_04870 [Propionibacteriaceae bacterium]|jgi:hypothetical protein|nr:hypothetical protein [Propionibacteriaceae bacterium]